MNKGDTMAAFIIDQKFWDLFPQAKLGIIIASGVTNDPDQLDQAVLDEIRGNLDAAQTSVSRYLTAEVFSENPSVKVWREAFSRFKTKKGARSSIEALLKRAHQGKSIPTINPLVDLYNTVSLTYGLPCGGEDVDEFCGDLRLTIANGGEAFIPLGELDSDPALPGEVIYTDEDGAVCRCWNWRDGQRTMLTESTRNAFLVMESVDPARRPDLEAAIRSLSQAIASHLKGTVITYLVDGPGDPIQIGNP